MKFSSFELHSFDLARKEAEKSDCSYRLGCIVTYKHSVVGKGHNSAKSNPVQIRYNAVYRVFEGRSGRNYVPTSTHAEVAALTSIPKKVLASSDMRKAKLFVYRLSNNGSRALARPCDSCIQAIQDYGIEDVYYTDSSRYAYLHLA